MDKQTQAYIDQFMAELMAKNPGESEFHQAVKEVIESVAPVVMAYPYMREQKVLERMVEPERVIMFRVPWHRSLQTMHNARWVLSAAPVKVSSLSSPTPISLG